MCVCVVCSMEIKLRVFWQKLVWNRSEASLIKSRCLNHPLYLPSAWCHVKCIQVLIYSYIFFSGFATLCDFLLLFGSVLNNVWLPILLTSFFSLICLPVHLILWNISHARAMLPPLHLYIYDVSVAVVVARVQHKIKTKIYSAITIQSLHLLYIAWHWSFSHFVAFSFSFSPFASLLFGWLQDFIEVISEAQYMNMK